MNKALNIIDRIEEWVGKVIAWLVYMILAIIVAELVLRSLLSFSIIWAWEMDVFLMMAYTVLAGGYILLHNGHVSMDLVYRRLSGSRKVIVDLISYLLLFMFCGVLLWEGGKSAYDAIRLGERAASIWSPIMWPVKLTIPVGAFLILVQRAANTIRVIGRAYEH